MYKKILVPLDGSKLAETALKHAEMLAQTHQGKLILFTVVQPPTMVGHEPNELQLFHENMEKLKEESENYLNSLKGEFREKKITTETQVVVGSVVKEIVDFANRQDVDLVAIASHGRSGLGRVFFGSVAAGVLNKISQPLLIIRAQ